MKIFLDDFGIFLGRKRNRFVVKREGEIKEFVADDVDSIICCSSGVAMSASALDLAVQNSIQVIFARYRGWPYAVLMPASMTGSVRARREQFIAYNDQRSLVLAKKFIAGKLVNQANFLKLMAKNRRQTDPNLAERLYESGKLIDEVNKRIGREQGSNIDEKRQQVMNLEAEGARYYWDSIRQILPAELGFTGRETRGARDSFNAMLNFGYQTILFPEVWKAVSYAGLDFYAGYLHADRPGKPSLVLDLMEEFRQQLVDRTLVGLITKNVIKPNEILATEVVEEGRVLSKDVIKVLVASFQERLDSEVMFNGQKGSLKSFIYLQARCVVRFLLKEAEYVPFCLGWWSCLRYVVIYDITDDNLRALVAETLKDYGLQRIQYSAFFGSLRRDELNSLLVDLKNLIKDLVENVQLYPVCDSCFKGRKEVGQPKKYELKEEKDKIAYF